MKKLTLIASGAILAFLLVAFVPGLLEGPGLAESGPSFEDAMRESLLLALGVVFLGGVLTSLTPCVYPLIPITVAVFGAKSASSRMKGALLSSVYVLGMAVMYASLGLLAALTGKVFGSVMSNPWVIGVIATVFVLFGISMLGVFQIRLPSGLQTRLSQVGGEGYAGAFAMGLVAGVVAAPCTGPVLGGVLTYVATTGDALLGTVLLFTFALGMGLLFFVLGTFSVSLPKSGTWMDVVESIFGIALLVVALYFLKDVVPALQALVQVEAGWVMWVTGGVAAAGVLLGGIHLSFHGPALHKVGKAAGVLLLTGAIFLRVGALGAVPADHGGELHWLTSESETLALASAEGKPAMVDFSADWCTACKELQKYTFPDPAVQEELSRFVIATVDLTDDESPEYARLKEKYGFPGLPYIVFYDSKGEQRKDLTVTGFRRPEDFLKILAAVK
ncbi:MAG: cytochrome c biogenesis protein CcdA [Deltaproteobacteria bacterium]|nr:cytochrome c biogenesis protein CcdA [Deltaproteobacteria bacterium]